MKGKHAPVHTELLGDFKMKVCQQTATEWRTMQDNGWRAKAAKKYKATTNSNHSLPVAPNLLARNFEADVFDPKWVSNITTIWTEEGWLYLAVVPELFSRQVMDWVMTERMTVIRVCDALNMALWWPNYSAAYQKLFDEH